IRISGGFYTAASGGLGYGLPAAVGIALGSPGRRVICLLGDGSSLYSIQALWTAARHRLPVSFLVLNNGGYGALKALGAGIEVGAGGPHGGTDGDDKHVAQDKAQADDNGAGRRECVQS